MCLWALMSIVWPHKFKAESKCCVKNFRNNIFLSSHRLQSDLLEFLMTLFAIYICEHGRQGMSSSSPLNGWCFFSLLWFSWWNGWAESPLWHQIWRFYVWIGLSNSKIKVTSREDNTWLGSVHVLSLQVMGVYSVLYLKQIGNLHN